MSLARQAGAILRRARGTTSLRQVARSAGVSNATLSEVERGENNMTLGRLERLGDTYGVKWDLSAVTLAGDAITPDDEEVPDAR